MFNFFQNKPSKFLIRKLRLLLCLILGLSFALISTPALANLAITSTATAGTLQTALQGSNVTVSNVSVNQGSTGGQVGTFTGGLTGGAGPVLNVDSGVVMVTGTVTSAAGPNNNSSITTGLETGPTDANLATVDSGVQFDTAILNFNVVPSGNYMALDFVFGSDEYNEYVCTVFNDAMGIFVSGPGITGSANIARLSTNLSPISVNQINRGIKGSASVGVNAAPCNLNNSAFYVKNIGDSTAESTTPNSALGTSTSAAYTNLQYDGFTVPLTAQLKVIPGSTYTVKVVIADIGDAFWDSAVFIDGVRSFNLDLGDAPDSYGTVPVDQTIQLPGPARHSTGQDIYLGSVAPDAENTVTPATSPNAANADDINGIDDEDAFSSDLSIASGITSYSLNNVPVHNTVATAKLMGWIDFNKNGSFLDAGEVASTNVAVGQTAANLSWAGFASPTAGTSYARFRITTDPNITSNPTPINLANNGEVEDYRVFIANLDYGDAPDPNAGTGAGNYKTTASDGGPSHILVSGLSLGPNIDNEAGTLQNIAADADDTDKTPDDEDSVSSFPILTTTSGKTYTVPVSVTKTISGNAYLVGYIDFNKDGDFEDTGERSSTVTVSASGTQNVSFTTPAGVTTGNTYARFRLSSTQSEAQSSFGTATSGEVEDYQITITTNANALLVKRITGINGNHIKNPNDNTPLNTFVDDTTSVRQTDDNDPGWPSGYLLGAIDAGKVLPGDLIEYTVYFLNAGGSTANTVKICDLITGQQDFLTNAYGANQDIELKIGKASNSSTFLTQANDTSDRGQVIYAPTTPPTSCQLKGTNTNSTVVIDVTGSTGLPTLPSLPGSTGSGTPDNSFGLFRFVTRVKP